VRGARQIDVALSDRSSYVGEVLGTDPQDDLAVVRLVDAPLGLPTLSVGDSTVLRPGDLLQTIDGEPVRSMDDLGEKLDRDGRPGQMMTLNVIRGAQTLDLPVTLSAWPQTLPRSR